MDKEQIKQKLNTIFRKFFQDNEIELARESTAMDIFGWDSLSHVELMITVEDSFDIRFKRNEVIRLNDVGELIDLISSKLQA